MSGALTLVPKDAGQTGERSDAWLWPENIEKEESAGTKGIFESYEQLYDDSSDKYRVLNKTIMDGEYALAYCRNVLGCLAPILRTPAPRLLDAGCGPGVITDGFRRLLLAKGVTAPQICGKDVSRTAIRWATEHFPHCRFSAGSADNLSEYPDGYFDVIHAREFYPFTRSDDIALHRTYLQSFAAKLAPSGIVVSVQIITERTLNDTLAHLTDEGPRVGYARSFKKPLLPLRFHRKIGDLVYAAPFSLSVRVLSSAVEAVKPGKLSYCFIFQRT